MNSHSSALPQNRPALRAGLIALYLSGAHPFYNWPFLFPVRGLSCKKLICHSIIPAISKRMRKRFYLFPGCKQISTRYLNFSGLEILGSCRSFHSRKHHKTLEARRIASTVFSMMLCVLFLFLFAAILPLPVLLFAVFWLILPIVSLSSVSLLLVWVPKCVPFLLRDSHGNGDSYPDFT